MPDQLTGGPSPFPPVSRLSRPLFSCSAHCALLLCAAHQLAHQAFHSAAHQVAHQAFRCAAFPPACSSVLYTASHIHVYHGMSVHGNHQSQSSFADTAVQCSAMQRMFVESDAMVQQVGSWCTDL